MEEAEKLWEDFTNPKTRLDALKRYIFAERPWGRTVPEVNTEVLYLCNRHIATKAVRDMATKVHPRGRWQGSCAAEDVYHLCKGAFGIYIRTGPGKTSIKWGWPNMSIIGLTPAQLTVRAYLEYKDIRSGLELDYIVVGERPSRDILRRLETSFVSLEQSLRKVSFEGLNVTGEEVFNSWQDWRETYKSLELRGYTIRMQFTNRIKTQLTREGILKA